MYVTYFSCYLNERIKFWIQLIKKAEIVIELREEVDDALRWGTLRSLGADYEFGAVALDTAPFPQRFP